MSKQSRSQDVYKKNLAVETKISKIIYGVNPVAMNRAFLWPLPRVVVFMHSICALELFSYALIVSVELKHCFYVFSLVQGAKTNIEVIAEHTPLLIH